MNLEAMSRSPVGSLVPIAGTDPRSNEHYEHRAFLPDPLPRTIELEPRTWQIVIGASTALARLDQAATQMPGAALERLRRPSLQREAQSTSALEGTHAAFTDLLEADLEDEVARVRAPALVEVLNYVRAAELAYDWVPDRPITLRMLAELQLRLVQRTMGELSDAGNIRDRQVVVGAEGSPIVDARYIPPPPGDQLQYGMEELIGWINDDLQLPDVVRAALAHYQFEALHPFSDGNGRIGRLLVVLQLLQYGAVRVPILIVSPWFEARRRQYQDQLLAVSETGDFDTWISFFCEGLTAQALRTVERVEHLAEFQHEVREIVHTHPIRGVGARIAEDLVSRPLVSATWAAETYDVSYQAANNALARLTEAGVLKEMTGRSYGRIYGSQRVLGLFEG